MNTPKTHFIHSMDYSRREQIVGIFILLASIALFAQLFISSRAADLFADTRTYTIELKNPIGVDEDTKVKVSGLDVGWVEQVDLTARNTFAIRLQVYEKFAALIREDSRASVSKLAVVGDSVINISPGDIQRAELKDGAAIGTEEGMTMDDIVSRLQPVLEKTEASVVQFSDLLSAISGDDIRTISHDLQSTVANLKALSDTLNDKNNSLNQMLSDASLSQGLNSTITTSQNALNESRSLMRNANSNLARLPEVIDKLELLIESLSSSANDLPALLEDTDQLINDSSKVVDDISNTWPLSNFVEAEPNHEQTIPALPAN